ncbi:biotin--[acetyl-CoA-carboxylase] ligase, partial [Halomonas sp. SIMBA_159]
PGYVIVAEAQTAGRGRRGKVWYSPFGASLYFSMYWRLEQGVQAAMGLSLIVAIALSRVLEQCYKLSPTVKWPNDVY